MHKGKVFQIVGPTYEITCWVRDSTIPVYIYYVYGVLELNYDFSRIQAMIMGIHIIK